MHWRTLAERTGGWVRQEFVALVALLAVVGGTWAFIEVADEVLEREHRSLDEAVLLALRDPADPSDAWGPPWLEQAASDVTGLGGVAVLAMAIAAVAGFLLLARTYRQLTLVLLATLGGWLISAVLKAVIDRPRPTVVPQLTLVHTASFPSGHAMNSAVVYLTLAALLARLTDRWRLKLFILGTAVGLTLLVGLTRVYLGVHYPSDVLAGWAAGLAWAATAWLAVELVNRWRRGTVEEEVGVSNF